MKKTDAGLTGVAVLARSPWRTGALPRGWVTAGLRVADTHVCAVPPVTSSGTGCRREGQGIEGFELELDRPGLKEICTRCHSMCNTVLLKL